jgi:predicted O-methyltransferase YrrM
VPAVIDFVFIDGDHSYDQVLKDLINYGLKVKPGGIVAGHDWIHGRLDEAVKEFFKGKEINLGDDTTWWVYV